MGGNQTAVHKRVASGFGKHARTVHAPAPVSRGFLLKHFMQKKERKKVVKTQKIRREKEKKKKNELTSTAV